MDALPVAEPAPPGALCAEHPSVAASATCPRCGNFACQACLVAVGDRLCCSRCGAAARAPLGSESARLIANLVDNLVVFAPAAVAALGMLLASERLDVPWVIALTAIGVALTLVALVTNVVLVAKHGQSVGKRMLHLRVVRTDHTRASWQRIVFLRNVVPSLIGGVPVLGNVLSLADALFIFRPDKRCLHDHLADTIVVQADANGPRL